MSIMYFFTVVLTILCVTKTVSTARVSELETRNQMLENVIDAVKNIISVAHENDPEKCYNSKPSNCAELVMQGNTKSGIYTIYPKPWFSTKSLAVYCDMETDNGGWIVFQRRSNIEPRQDFQQDWQTYQRGFGELDKEFWLGNDNLHTLTNQEYVTLRVDLEDFEGATRYAMYKEFLVSNCDDKYRLKVGGFRGNTGDNMAYHNNVTFVTYDNGDDKNCAKSRCTGGWWFNDCYRANLNGQYLKGFNQHMWKGVIWNSFRPDNYSLKLTEMKFRPSYFNKIEV